MPEGIYISVCSDGHDKRDIKVARVKAFAALCGGGQKVAFFSFALILLIGFLYINPKPFYSSGTNAIPGTPNLSNTSLNIEATGATSVTIAPGSGFRLSDSSHTAAYSVTTNNFTGYEARLVGPNNTRNLVKTDDSTKTLPSISTSILETNFNSSTPGLMNHWGIKPNKIYNSSTNTTSANTTTIYPGPDTTGIVLEKTGVANSAKNYYDIAVGAMVDGSIPAGTYAIDTVLEVTPNPIYYELHFHKNTNDTVTDMPGTQTNSITDTTFKIDTLVPKRAHYTFDGWCLGTTVNVNGTDTCTDGAGGAGTVFQPGDNFGIDQTMANISTVYAMWGVESYTQITKIRYQNADGTYPSTYTEVDSQSVKYGDAYSWSSTSIANFDSTTYSPASVPAYNVSGDHTNLVNIERNTSTITLTAGTGIDTVAVTGDGVKTGGTAGTTSTATVYYGGEVTITATPAANYDFENWTGDSTYTNNPETITNVSNALSLTANGIQAKVMQNFPSSECTATPTVAIDNRDGQSYTIQRLADGKCWMMDNLNLGATTITASSLDSTNTNVAVPVSVNDTFNTWKVANSSTPTSLTTAAYTSVEGTDATSGTKYGSLYNFCAASAGTICSSSNSSNASYDICPAGWRLPTGGSSGEFQNLRNQTEYNSFAKMRASIANGGAAFALAGDFVRGSVTAVGTEGYYWSSTRSTTENMYGLFMMTNTWHSADNGTRTVGRSIRCVIEENIQPMQNISQSSLDSLVPSTGNSVTLKDTRDNQRYTVTKLGDGNVWMTQNLRFTGTELTPADSNVKSDITMSYGPLTDATTADSVDDAKIQNSNSDSTGVWYNYVAATAGTITGSSNSNSATQDICPAGWRLPTRAEMSGITSYVSAFSPVYGGHYRTGQIYNSNRGNMWSSDAYTGVNRYYLTYYSGALSMQNNTGRIDGFFIRCIYDKTVDMQNIPQSTVNSLLPTSGSTATLKDTRDDNLYTVAKLADGNVWMTQNLRTTGTITADKSNFVSGSFNVSQYSLASSDSSYANHCDATNGFNNACSKNSDDSVKGVYYNFYAASAGTISTNSNTDPATQDICPAGWRLPTYNELTTLKNTGNATTFNAVTSYYYITGSLQTNVGVLWSSTYSGNVENRYQFQMTDGAFTTISTAGYRSRNGFSIRCIYDKTPIMQNISESSLNSLAPSAGNSTTLKDVRDDQMYTITKLGDGNYWMTQNLRFTGDTLDSTTSNVASTYTPSSPYRVNNGNGYIDVATTLNNDYGVAGIHNSGSATTGVWYNFAAASAGTVTEASDMREARYDVCPAGWRLPTINELSGIKSYQSQFNITTGGFYSYNSTSIQSSARGYWTTATPNEATTRYFVYYNGSSMADSSTSYRLDRKSSTFVRCIYDKTVNMQNISANTLSTLAPNAGNFVYLRDTRDDKRYKVTKLSDGNYWMTQNLDLEFAGQTITPADSNVESNFTLTFHSLQNGNSYDEPRVYSSGYTSEGLWYNYAAATAGTITGASNTTEATSSLCPAGWRLPTHTEQTNITSYVSQFSPSIPSGAFDGGANNNASYVYYWSSTSANAANRYGLYYNGSTMNTNIGTRNGGRDMGLNIRCIYSKPTMQNFSNADANAMSVGETKILTDSRDNQDYTVSKLPDGNVWMTRNLAIGCNGVGSTYGSSASSKTLTSANSDVSSSFATPTASVAGATSYTAPKQLCSATYGAYYNYAAASAGDVKVASSTTEAKASICPAGWRLPNWTEQKAITSYASQFNPSLGGYTNGGNPNYTSYGFWWSSTANGATARHVLRYYTGHTTLDDAASTEERTLGFFVRCIKKK